MMMTKDAMAQRVQVPRVEGAPLGVRRLEGEHVLARRGEVPPRQRHHLGPVDAAGEIAPALGGVRGRVLEDVDQLEALAERPGMRRGKQPFLMNELIAGAAGTADVLERAPAYVLNSGVE